MHSFTINRINEYTMSHDSPLLVQGYEGMKQRAASMASLANIRLAEAVGRLVRLYDAWGKKDEAQKWRATEETMKTTKDTKKP
jgi:hypothetical protein